VPIHRRKWARDAEQRLRIIQTPRRVDPPQS
jgi:hypothetical protein